MIDEIIAELLKAAKWAGQEGMWEEGDYWFGYERGLERAAEIVEEFRKEVES